MAKLSVSIYEESCVGVYVSENVWVEELNSRVVEGSDETYEHWLKTLREVSESPEVKTVVLYSDNVAVGTGMLVPSISLHHSNLVSVFGMVAKEGYGTKLIRALIKVAREEGYSFLHLSIKESLNVYKTRVLKL